MRIRSTKPEFWRSATIAELDWDTRLVLKALEAYVDDNGVGKDNVVIFCADAFPHDLAKSSEIVAKISRSLARLSEAGLIVRYEVDGEPLIYVRHWRKWQYIDKPKAGRYPRPDGSMNYRDPVDESIGAGQSVAASEIREDSPEVRENFAKSSPEVPEECPQIQSGEQGNRGTEESSLLTLVEGGVGGDPQNLPVAHSAPGAPSKSTRGSRLPEGWMPDDETIAAMRQQFPHVDLRAEHEKFTDYWRGAAGAKGRKADWTATWRNWIRRAAENAPRTSASAPAASNGLGKPSQKALGWEKAGEALIAELEGRR
ncbi:replication initiation protein [Mycobacterium phage Babsiella]|uniref:Helix-turn-helix DNA binding domain protein n=1 Tax=Mycobacterium phage Babsiella TaxID=2902842 RepID=G8I6U7_9CAUD|nr:replication initiation protein [Mycobacterium phage Babsiella]AER48441.1 hypothetical protein BABSIELLA_64 [Mycobacterium phage Babsiella]